jgi:cytidine deaminase
MNTREIKIKITAYSGTSELPEEEQQLLQQAAKSASRSYAPYSEFHVGAAVLLENGEVICGSNQENAAYPAGLCAERVALFYANSKYPGVTVKALAISAHADHFVIDKPISPCGTCRQVIAETENRQQSKIKILMQGESGSVNMIEGIENLLPLTFYEEKLKKK